jgi:hypothetical protein
VLTSTTANLLRSERDVVGLKRQVLGFYASNLGQKRSCEWRFRVDRYVLGPFTDARAVCPIQNGSSVSHAAVYLIAVFTPAQMKLIFVLT